MGGEVPEPLEHYEKAGTNSVPQFEVSQAFVLKIITSLLSGISLALYRPFSEEGKMKGEGEQTTTNATTIETGLLESSGIIIPAD